MRRFSRSLIPLFIPNQILWQTLILTLASDQAPLTAQISPPSLSTNTHFSFSPPPPYLLKLQTRCFSIHGVSPLLECPPLPVTSAKNSDFVSECLVNSLGFSRAEAISIAAKRIQRFLSRFPKIFHAKPEWLEDVVVRVEEELGIPRQSEIFLYGVGELAAMSKKTLKSKFEIFKSYGWSQSDVLTLTRKSPSCLRLSDANIRTRLDYFMKELGLDPAYLASHPVLLKYSLENRIFPRNAVLMVLKESRVKETHLSFWTAMYINDAEFLRRFVLKYKDMAPDLCDVYFRYKANSPVKAVNLSNLK